MIGSGVFGCVKLEKLLNLDLVVAEKIMDNKTKKKNLLSEVVIHLTLSGCKFVPIFFGFIEDYSDRISGKS